MIRIIDCNNFYASCERNLDPSLKGKPVVVFSNNDGEIIARSEEAKALDIDMPVPIFEIKRMMKQYDIRGLAATIPNTEICQHALNRF